MLRNNLGIYNTDDSHNTDKVKLIIVELVSVNFVYFWRKVYVSVA